MGLGLHNESDGDEDVPVADARNSVAGRRLSAMGRLVNVVFKLVVTWYVCKLHEWKVDRIQAPASAIISEFEVGATTAIFLAYNIG
eukprot:scaffold30943_cov100-Skeletonema_dohrnii-CCMP3373.AAC.1